MSKEAVILDALRTPVGRKDGVLSRWRPDDLAGEVMSALVNRNGVDIIICYPDSIPSACAICAFIHAPSEETKRVRSRIDRRRIRRIDGKGVYV